MNLFIAILAFLSIIISFLNLIFLFKILKKSEEESQNKMVHYDEASNELLARFQKITSSRLRAMDNKIEIVDQLLKDIDNSYIKTFSLLTELEKENNEIFKAKKIIPVIPEKKHDISEESLNDVTINDSPEIHEKLQPLSSSSEEVEEETSTLTDENPKKNQILNMRKEGLTPQEIAKNLKIGVGEVMLYINLYNE